MRPSERSERGCRRGRCSRSGRLRQLDHVAIVVDVPSAPPPKLSSGFVEHLGAGSDGRSVRVIDIVHSEADLCARGPLALALVDSEVQKGTFRPSGHRVASADPARSSVPCAPPSYPTSEGQGRSRHGTEPRRGRDHRPRGPQSRVVRVPTCGHHGWRLTSREEALQRRRSSIRRSWDTALLRLCELRPRLKR